MTAREKKGPHDASPISVLTGWARQGVQSFVAAQKILVDLAAQENALLSGMARNRLSNPGFRPGVSMVGIAETGVNNIASVGKILLDLAADETALVVDGVKEGLRLPAAAGAMAEVVRHRVDTLIEMHKRLLDATTQQMHRVAESYREGKGALAAAHLVEIAPRGIEGLVESEKKFLNLAVQEFSTATKGNKRTGKSPRGRMEILTNVVREGGEKYIETQKKVLELVIDQLEAAAKSGHERKEGSRKEMQPLLGELSEKSVKNFVAAEKSLLDLATKSMNGPGRAEGRRSPQPHHGAPRVAKKPGASSRRAVAKVA
jgi:hypothetical protein